MVFVLQVSETLSILVTEIEGWLALLDEPVAVCELELAAPAAPAALESFALLMVPLTRTSCPMCEFNFELSAVAGSWRSYVVPALSMMVNLPAEPPRQPSTLFPAAIEESWPAAEGVEEGCCADGSLDGAWVEGDWVDGADGLADGDCADGSVVGELDEGELCATAQLTETSRIKVNSNVLRIWEIASKES